MSIKVLQGEREMARDNWPLGQFEIEFQPAPKGVARVGVQFEIDANGILHVLARDTKTGGEKTVEINSAVDVSDEAVEAMISESPIVPRDLASASGPRRNCKQEAVSAVAAAFERVGDSIEPVEKEMILRAVAQLREALGTNDTKRLQAANTTLDDATQGLAAAVVEKAMQGAPVTGVT